MYNDTAAREGFASLLSAAAQTQDLSEDLRDPTRVLLVVITFLATLFVVLRFLARWKHGIAVGADDWTSLVALVLLYANFGVHIALIEIGVGLHTGALSVDQIESLSKVMFAGELLYVISINVYKISVLFFYWRTFPIRMMMIGGLVLGAFSVLWSFSAIFVIIFQCAPVSKAWRPWAEGQCGNLLQVEPIMAGLNIFCDVAILCLPIRPVLSLRINAAQKAFVIGTFLLGSYVVFASCYRLAMFFKLDPTDITYTLADGEAWDVVEMASGIISACLPTLGPILKTMTSTVMTNATLMSRGGRKSALGGANMMRSSGALPQDFHLVTIGGSGTALASSACPTPQSMHRSLRDKYGDGHYDDDDDEDHGSIGAPSSLAPPYHSSDTHELAALAARHGSGSPITRSRSDEAPLRPAGSAAEV